MRQSRPAFPRLRDFSNLWAAALAVLAVSACAPREYMGISLKQGIAAPDLQDLARRAKSGDKRAQLDLGIAFEEGRSVERDLTKARSLYRLAATDSGGPVWIYVPAVVKGERGRVMQVGESPRQRGLAQAKLRLEALGD